MQPWPAHMYSLKHQQRRAYRSAEDLTSGAAAVEARARAACLRALCADLAEVPPPALMLGLGGLSHVSAAAIKSLLAHSKLAWSASATRGCTWPKRTRAAIHWL